MRSVAIPEPLHKRLKATADTQGMKLRTLVERLLKDGLARKVA